jgi:ATP-binding cassette, subfamily B, bacterial PglK
MPAKGPSILHLLGRLWGHLSPRRRRQFMAVTVLMLLSAVAEVVSLGAVLPFLGIITAPEMAMQSPVVAGIMGWMGLSEANQLVLPLTLAFVVAAIVAGLLRIALLWATTRVAYAAGSDLSVELYRRTLYQNYAVHVSRNSSAILSGVGKVSGAMNILSQCLMLLSAAVLLISITLALIAMDPVIASASILGFGICYGIITLVVRRRLRNNGLRIAERQTEVFKVLQEGLGGIRDVLLGGTQKIYVDQYEKADRPLRRDQGSNVFIAGSPRFVMEAAGMVMIAALAFALVQGQGDVTADLPVLGALALGAQRLLPVLQQAYSAWSIIIGSEASLSDTVALLDQPLPNNLDEPVGPALDLNHSIRFDKVSFRYGAEGPLVLDGVDIEISKGARVGIVGATGSGKSTALDILMGLLEPSEGQLLVDEQLVSDARIRDWQRTIGHVPQTIYLSDASIAENIAFGSAPEEIDMDRVREAARQAQVTEFVERDAGGYDAVIGERGVRLSGGQRQRIGIARALYRRSSVLVLDEATSALDNVTERSLMEALAALGSDLTIIMIAHRLSTVQNCDVIIELQGGKVVARGSYDQLLETSPSFRRMASNSA